MFSVEIDAMDKQHQHLISLANYLLIAEKNGDSREAVGRVLASLVEYTHQHFASEERLMQEIHFPGLSEHKEQHKQICQNICDLENRFNNGQSVLASDVVYTIRNWLVNHVQAADRMYGVHSRKHRKALARV